MNRNEYRRALIMLRSLKSGVSGYVRLERRTLMGTLQFTVNGASDGGEMYAVLLYRNNGGFSAIRLDQFAAPRYGQTGLVWKFDPRNIESRTLEQYDLAAVIEIRNGVCELLLCGNLNGSVEADWIQVREAACRLFSPVRISGAPIAPIDERISCKSKEDEPQTLPDYSEESPAYPGNEEISPVQPREESPEDETLTLPEADLEKSSVCGADCSSAQSDASSAADSARNAEQTALPEEVSQPDGDGNCACQDMTDIQSGSGSAEHDDFDLPAGEYECEPDELDTPAQDAAFMTAARAALSTSIASADSQSDIEPDEFDTPAQDDFPSESTAGEQLSLSDPSAKWPDAIESLRGMFFSSEAVVPFETDGYVFIRAPLPDGGEVSSCLIGLSCENGLPDRVCYAIPAVYTPEPPAGLEGYVWRGDRTRGYWVICEAVSDSPSDE